jgi:hypothetical protein
MWVGHDELEEPSQATARRSIERPPTGAAPRRCRVPPGVSRSEPDIRPLARLTSRPCPLGFRPYMTARYSEGSTVPARLRAVRAHPANGPRASHSAGPGSSRDPARRSSEPSGRGSRRGPPSSNSIAGIIEESVAE